MWFTNYTFTSEEPNLPDNLRTYQDVIVDGKKYDWTKVDIDETTEHHGFTCLLDSPLAAARIRPRVQPLWRGRGQSPGVSSGRGPGGVSGGRIRLRPGRGECHLQGEEQETLVTV